MGGEKNNEVVAEELVPAEVTPATPKEDSAPLVPSRTATAGTPEEFKDLKEQMRLIVIVLLLGLCGIVVAVAFAIGATYATYASQKQASYEDLTKQVIQSSDKIDTLTAEINNLNFTLQQQGK